MFQPTSMTIMGTTSEHTMPEISLLAFSPDVRFIVLERDNYACVESGRKKSDGWLLDTAHYNHDRNYPYYNHPENGRTLCVSQHLMEHCDLFQQDPTDYNFHSMRLIAERAWERGLRTKKFYEAHPTAKTRDMEEVIGILKSRNLDPDQILTFAKQKPRPKIRGSQHIRREEKIKQKPPKIKQKPFWKR